MKLTLICFSYSSAQASLRKGVWRAQMRNFSAFKSTSAVLRTLFHRTIYTPLTSSSLNNINVAITDRSNEFAWVLI